MSIAWKIVLCVFFYVNINKLIIFIYTYKLYKLIKVTMNYFIFYFFNTFFYKKKKGIYLGHIEYICIQYMRIMLFLFKSTLPVCIWIRLIFFINIQKCSFFWMWLLIFISSLTKKLEKNRKLSRRYRESLVILFTEAYHISFFIIKKAVLWI